MTFLWLWNPSSGSLLKDVGQNSACLHSLGRTQPSVRVVYFLLLSCLSPPRAFSPYDAGAELGQVSTALSIWLLQHFSSPEPSEMTHAHVCLFHLHAEQPDNKRLCSAHNLQLSSAVVWCTTWPWGLTGVFPNITWELHIQASLNLQKKASMRLGIYSFLRPFF